MKTRILFLSLTLCFSLLLKAQQKEVKEIWSLTDCINYALDQNIQVRKSILTIASDQLYADQAVNNKLPSVNASASQNFSWSKTSGEAFAGNNSTNYSLNSSILIYNGSRLNTLIKQAQLEIQSGIFESETIKESISLSILNFYLQVLFNEEKVKNAEKQIEASTEQLNLAEERLNRNIISRSDYLQVKSQLASEKLSLANAVSQLAMAKVNLMQIMDLPVDDKFSVIHPDMGELTNNGIAPVATEVYTNALGFKPEIKSAGFRKESAELNIKIASKGYYPSLSASAGIGTGYANSIDDEYFLQLQNRVSPSIGLQLSVPVFQKRQIKTNVSVAKINYQNAELQELDTKNQLRKEIEQVCLDVVSAQTEFDASREKYDATTESYSLSKEKFDNGMINSVDFLIQKTNLIVAESQFLQSKYNLIFSYKILDFYSGNPIKL